VRNCHSRILIFVPDNEDPKEGTSAGKNDQIAFEYVHRNPAKSRPAVSGQEISENLK
jgi:hypothetical protein